MANYVLRKVDDALWNRVRQRAQASGWPLRALMVQLLDDFAAGLVSPSGTPPMMGIAADAEPPAPSTGAMVKLHDGDQTVRVPGAVVAREETDSLAFYNEHGLVGRFARRDVKSWWIDSENST